MIEIEDRVVKEQFRQTVCSLDAILWKKMKCDIHQALNQCIDSIASASRETVEVIKNKPIKLL
jgi:hypothetical protein